MKALALLLLVLSSGCASYNSTQVRSISTNGVETTSTRVSIKTLWDAKSELSKLSATTTDKSQRLGIGSLSQESTSTNLQNIIEAVASGVVKGLAKP